MEKLGILLLTTISAVAVMNGCSDPDPATTSSSAASSGSGSSSSSSGAGGGADLGDMPSYGAQIDRFGRPAINTALNNTFNADDAAKGMAKDNWNASADETMWGKNYAAEVGANLAIIDSLDANCGNQLLADPAKMDATRYGTLAGVLADDRQWLNADGMACTTYLAVEANATGLIPNMDCGGRALNYDVIDISYSALAVGAVMGVDDGIPVPTHAQGKTFPYLASPL